MPIRYLTAATIVGIALWAVVIFVVITVSA